MKENMCKRIEKLEKSKIENRLHFNGAIFQSIEFIATQHIRQSY